MERIGELYARLLGFGFISIREALASRDFDWADAEVEMLHNVPSLLNESNLERHRYYWFTEREHYLKWTQEPGRERARSRTKVYYEPLWREMHSILLESLPEGAKKAAGAHA